MAGFTESALSKKLSELNSSQQSIQTLSLWLIHHRKHHATIVNVWFKELQKGTRFNKINKINTQPLPLATMFQLSNICGKCRHIIIMALYSRKLFDAVFFHI
jgi:uncharacterized protein (DUF2249 family)